MLVCYLGMLGGVCFVTVFMRFCGSSMRFRSLFMVSGCFVVIVFRHYYCSCSL